MSSEVSSQSDVRELSLVRSRTSNVPAARALPRSQTSTNVLSHGDVMHRARGDVMHRAPIPSDGTKETLKKPFYFI